MATRSRYLTGMIAGGIAGAIVGAIYASRHADLNVNLPAELTRKIGPAWPMWVSLVLYFAFGLYWGIAARNSAAAKSSEPWASTLLHQALINIAVIAAFYRVPGLTGRWLPSAGAVAVIGIVIQVAGTWLAVWARQHLGRNWSAEISTKVDHQLIRSGPYRLLRHPIYTGNLTIFLGIAVASGEWHALIALIIVALAYVRKIYLEEKNLRQAFGADYEAFCRDSWAVIPWVL
jgi:protein-S-isoprenylcysteine O-methyltransferase Ste14